MSIQSKLRHQRLVLNAIIVAVLLSATKGVWVAFAQSETTQQPLQEERQKLLQKITDMEKKGVGVAPYLRALTAIDDMVKNGQSSDSIKQQVTRLKAAMAAQQASAMDLKSTRTSLPVSVTEMRTYLNSIEKQIRTRWKPAQNANNTACVSMTLDANGNVSQAVAEGSPRASKLMEENLLNVVRAIHFGPPPAAALPLKLVAVYCEEHGIEVYKENISYTAYMEDTQRQIKRAWHPPTAGRFLRTMTSFMVLQDGSLTREKIEKSSGDTSFDAACIRAIRDASPVRPMPAGSRPHNECEMTFDYNAK